MRYVINDMVGQQYSHWTVIGVAEHHQSGHRKVVARCVCGTQRDVAPFDIVHGKSRSCGCAQAGVARQRRRWTDSAILAALTPVTLELGRMPSSKELADRGHSRLATTLTRTGGGMKGWAKRLGLALSGAETHRGQAIEEIEADNLAKLGFRVERQSCRAPFDLLVNGVRVDVKSARHGVYKNHRSGGSCAGFVFALTKVPPTCDLYLLVGVDADNRPLWRYYVPASAAQVRMITITPKGKYSRFKENIDELRRLIAAKIIEEF